MTSDRRIPPLIFSQLSYLLSHCPFVIKVEQMWSGCRNFSLCDRFTLVIPFCLDYIKWDVIYDALYPLAPPDVIFGPEDENFRPYHGFAETKPAKNALSDWNSRDPTRLLSLILELRDLYIEYQRKRVEQVNDERLKFEISTMPAREGREMCKLSSLDKGEEVKFAVPLLDMDLKKLIVGTTWRHQPKIYLQVIYPVGLKYPSSAPGAPRPKLVSPSELKSWVSIDDFRLPTWLDGMCLNQYVAILEERLESQIKDAVSLIEVRRKFITALVPYFGRPVEADRIFCRRGTFLASSGTFTFLVHVSLPLQFPKQMPSLVLQSSQHFNSYKMPIKLSISNNYPWSPRWEASEMAERMFDFLVEECLNFKRYCNESMLQHR